MQGLRMPGMLRLLSRQLGASHAPLRRSSDRVEGVVLLVVLLAALGATVLAGWGAAWTGSYATRLAAVQASQRHQVEAVLLTDAQPGASDGSMAVVTAAWQLADSSWRSGSIEVSAGSRAGEHRKIWTDAAGSVVQRPMTRGDVFGLALAAGIGIVLASALVLLAVYRIARWLLDRGRLSDWDADWARTAPLWTDQSR